MEIWVTSNTEIYEPMMEFWVTAQSVVCETDDGMFGTSYSENVNQR